MKKYLIGLFVFSVILILPQCKSDKKEILDSEGTQTTCDTELKFITIKPIIELNCVSASCHGASSSAGSLVTYQDVVDKIEDGSFNRRVLSAGADMPLGRDWDSEESLAKVRCWIDNGFKE